MEGEERTYIFASNSFLLYLPFYMMSMRVIYMCTYIYIFIIFLYIFSFFTFGHLFHGTYNFSHRDMKFSLVIFFLFLFFLSFRICSISALLGIFISLPDYVYMYVCNTYLTCLNGLDFYIFNGSSILIFCIIILIASSPCLHIVCSRWHDPFACFLKHV